MALERRMPALFVGHGSPMNTLQTNRFTQAWRDLGKSMPRPRAILAISAHWYIPSTAVTAMKRAEPELMKAAQHNIIHRNNANRKVSRLTHQIAKLGK